MKAIILAAGTGTRIGNQLPKCLMRLPMGNTIMENQVSLLRDNGIKEIIVVVGFKKDVIMEEFPDLIYRYNTFYHITNTSKSLMMALESIDEDDIIWINGDVFLESEVIRRLLSEPGNVMAVNISKCGEEEVKYKTGKNGEIIEISKSVLDAEGESVGVNKITAENVGVFYESLKECDDDDYFEKGVEICISKGIRFYPVDISACKCVEIDFKEDYERVKEIAAD